MPGTKIDLRGNIVQADGFEGPLTQAISDVGDIVVGAPAITSAGESLVFAADATLRQVLQAIADELDPT